MYSLNRQMIDLRHDARRVTALWEDGHRSEFPSLWLFDNRPEHRDARNGQRLIDVADLPENPEIVSARNAADSVTIEWRDGAVASFPLAWLRGRCPCCIRSCGVNARLWTASDGELLRRFSWTAVTEDPAVRAEWLRAIAERGLAFLSGVPAESGRVLEVAALVGWVRDTNYGRFFDVRAVSRPGNLADTALALGLHTDNPYREPVPGLQILHCIRAGPVGGDSIFADGFAVVELLREENPQAVMTLEQTAVRFEYADANCHLIAERPLIEAGSGGRPLAVHYNNRSIATPCLPPDRENEFYAAYRAFARLLREPQLILTTRLSEGDVVVFDNRRVLHGRTAFAATAERHLQGCYLERDGLMSNLRVMERRVAEANGQR